MGAHPEPLHLEVVERWPGGLVVDLVLNGMSADKVTLGRDDYYRLLVPGAGRLAEDGRPELPAVGRFLAVPRGADVEVALLGGTEVRVPALRPLPHQPPRIDHHDLPAGMAAAGPDPAVYGGRAVYPARRVEVETPRDIRGCRVALLKIYPVRYDPADQSLLYTTRMRVRLTFRGGDGHFIDRRHRTPAFEAFFRALLLNADSLGNPPFRPGQPPPECEMLIITPALFHDEALRLAHWKNRRGIPTLVRTTAEAGTTAKEITSWVEQHYQSDWPELSYLLFFGDVGEADSVPCHYVTDHEDDGIRVGTDLYYGVMDVVTGEQDYFPDLFLGRISVDSVEQAATVVDKILTYEQAPYTGDGWLDSILIAAHNDPDRFFIETSEAIHDYLAPHGYSCNRQYADGTPPGSTEGVLQAINEQGVFLVTHRGHGQDRNSGDLNSGWVEPEFTQDHIPLLDNDPCLPVMFSVNCRTGWFDGETDEVGFIFDSFCEEVLRKTPGGVVGVIGDTRTSYSGYNDELLKGFIDAIWDQFAPFYPQGGSANPLPSPLYQMGAVLNFGKYWMYDKYIATGGAGYPDNEDWWPTETRNRIQFEVYHYFGDPSMEIWTGTPADDLVVSHNQQAFIGDTEFTVNVNLEQALVAVAKDGALLGRAISTGDQTTVRFAEPLDEPGQLTVCVTRHDQLPFLDGMVEVVPPDGPWVLYQAHQVDDTLAGGNGDGLVSPGETVDIHLALHNFGNAPATGVTAALASKSGQVEVLAGQSAYPPIDSGETAVNLQPFTIRVLPGCPDGELVRFTVTASDGMSAWESGFFIEIDGAHIVHYSHQVLDNLPGGGNQDYIADPGELFDLRVSLRNIGLVYASQVTARLSTTHPLVEIRAGESGFPNLAAGNVGTSFSPHFRVALDESIPCGTTVPFTLEVSAAEGLSSTGFQMLVGGWEVLFYDNMEYGPGDWTSGLDLGIVDWSIGDTGPPGAWFSPGEDGVKDNWLRSPSFSVIHNNASLSFRHQVVLEAGNDGCVLDLSTDGGNSWTDLGSRITYGGYTHRISENSGNPIGGRNAWSGTTGPTPTWVTVDLGDFTGFDALLRYRLACDNSWTPSGSGWLIDDLEVEGVHCHFWMSPDETIDMEMTCSPVSATLPFTVAVQAMVTNVCTDIRHKRLVAATLDLQLAGGYYMANLTSGNSVLDPGETLPWGIIRIFPGHPMLVGVNTFRISAYDITPPPYNQPPDFPASGDTAVDSCDVECLIP